MLSAGISHCQREQYRMIQRLNTWICWVWYSACVALC